jgi:site-specific DNA recombinase
MLFLYRDPVLFNLNRISVEWKSLGMSRKIRAAAYPRVSDESLKDSQTLQDQAKAIRAYCEQQGYELLECHIYPEAESAYNKPFREREQLMKMLDDAKKKRFDVIVITEFSRLARKQEEQTVLIALFKEYGVRVESIIEKLPDEDRMASVIRAHYGFASEIEHDRVLYRMHRGKMDRVANGNLTGFGKAKYGYSYFDTQNETSARYVINHSVIHLDPEGTEWTEPSVVLFCVDKLLIGWSCHGIAKRLTQLGVPTPKGSDVWTATTVHRLLVEDWYTETDDIVVMRWKMVDGKQVRRSLEEQVSIARGELVPPLYDRETYERVQEQLRLNKENALRSNKPYNQLGLLRVGYVRCGVCGKSMRGQYYHTDRKQGPDYRCKVSNGKDGLLNHHSVSINMDYVDTRAWEYALTYIQNPRLIRERVEQIRRDGKQPIDASVTKPSLTDIARKMNNLYKLAADATDDDTLNDLKAMLRDLERQKHDIEAIKYDLEEEAAKLEKLNAKIEKFERWCETVRERFTDPESQTDITYEEKRLAIQILHIVAVIYPSTQKERVELTVAPPNISKLLRDLVC